MKYPNREAILKMLNEAEANGETVFFLRSRDEAAVATLRFYKEHYEMMAKALDDSGLAEYAKRLYPVRHAFLKFSIENRDKMKWCGATKESDKIPWLPNPCYICVRGTDFDGDRAAAVESAFRDRFIKDFGNTGTLINQYFSFLDDASQDFEQLTICEKCAIEVYEKYKHLKSVEVRWSEHIYLDDQEYPISCNICDCDLQCDIGDKDCPENLRIIETKADLLLYRIWADSKDENIVILPPTSEE